ncbi:MAG: glycosyltransferase [Bacillales bacterium]|nr:glycosyltransferase [Bacillales bacterium]
MEDTFISSGISEDEQLALMRHCTLTIFPNLYKPLGIAALEAMAAKKLVVSANTGGLETFIQHQPLRNSFPSRKSRKFDKRNRLFY